MAAVTTSQRSFGGANIKGTPAMTAAAVRNDLTILKRRLDIIGLQEFKWRWYWRVLGVLFDPNWRSFPAATKGLARPVNGAQGLLWKTRIVKRVASHEIPAFDFTQDHGGIMDDRWIRAVLLQDIVTRLRCWYVSTHFVVGGDSNGDSARRKAFLRQNIAALDKMLDYCARSGEAAVLELDANLHVDSWAYEGFAAVLQRHGGRIVGQRGVEYLVVFDGPITRVVVDTSYALAPKQMGLKTDHEVRCIDHHLEGKRAR